MKSIVSLLCAIYLLVLSILCFRHGSYISACTILFLSSINFFIAFKLNKTFKEMNL